MKSLFVRLSVLTLAATGFAASTVISQAASKNHEIKPVVVGGVCTPICNPNKSTCGI